MLGLWKVALSLTPGLWTINIKSCSCLSLSLTHSYTSSLPKSSLHCLTIFSSPQLYHLTHKT